MKNKLVIIESEMIEPKGHFLSNMIDISNFFGKKLDIYWFLNKNFKRRETFIPKKPKIIKTIKSNKFKRKNNKLSYFIEEILLLFINILNIFYFSIIFIKDNNFKNYILALRSNYFLLPRYFSSFYHNYKNLGLTKKDHILFPSTRRKDIALVNFITKIDENHPKFHMRLFLMPKDRFKGFFYYLKEIENQLINKRAFLYIWDKKNYKSVLKNTLIKKGILISNLIFSYNPSKLFNRKYKKKNFTIGYAGNARKARGFHKLPKLINLVERKNIKFNYLIQFSKISDDLIPVRKKLYELAKKNSRIKIIEKYINNKEFNNILKSIDIMPILHDAKEINNVTSGTLYSCLPYEIPFTIPKGLLFMNNINKFKSYETGKNLNDIALKIIKISKNYSFYLKNAKLNFKILKKIVINDPLNKNFF